MKQICEISLCIDCRDAHHFPGEVEFVPRMGDSVLFEGKEYVLQDYLRSGEVRGKLWDSVKDFYPKDAPYGIFRLDEVTPLDRPLSKIEPGYSVTDMDTEEHFGTHPCDGCGSYLAGDRFDFMLWED